MTEGDDATTPGDDATQAMPPSAQASPPVDADGGGGGGGRSLLLIGSAVVVAGLVVGVGAALALTGGDSDKNVSTSTLATTTTSTATAGGGGSGSSGGGGSGSSGGGSGSSTISPPKFLVAEQSGTSGPCTTNGAPHSATVHFTTQGAQTVDVAGGNTAAPNQGPSGYVNINFNCGAQTSGSISASLSAHGPGGTTPAKVTLNYG